jgi:RNA polymerase sigma-70 factor (ECF subfamily)
LTRFDTTHWSVVVAAGGGDASAARRALATLCETYWYPLYAYVRRRGHDADRARDLTQAFFASLLARNDFAGLRQDRGRFRAFLLAALQHFLANDAARERAQKRGGGLDPLPLAFDDAEGRYRREPADTRTPEQIFARRWALTVIDDVLRELRESWQAAGKTREFDCLKDALLGEGPAGGYKAVAEMLGTSEGAVKVAVHRLRKQFQRHLKQRIADTVLDAAEVEDEIRYLIAALG